NAMIFGRGGGGGVVNRVTKTADFMHLGEITLQGGSFGDKRFATDFDRPLGNKLAFRANGVYEDSGSFRNYVDLQRWGLSPSLTYPPYAHTSFHLNYEHFRDIRVADRGVPSFRGLPADVDISTFYGDHNLSHVNANVNIGSVTAERQLG